MIISALLLLSLTQAPPSKRFVIATAANLRTEPRADAPQVARLRITTACDVDEENAEGWAKVRCMSASGWMKAEFLAPEPPDLARLLARSQDVALSVPERLEATQRVWSFCQVKDCEFGTLSKSSGTLWDLLVDGWVAELEKARKGKSPPRAKLRRVACDPEGGEPLDQCIAKAYPTAKNGPLPMIALRENGYVACVHTRNCQLQCDLGDTATTAKGLELKVESARTLLTNDVSAMMLTSCDGPQPAPVPARWVELASVPDGGFYDLDHPCRLHAQKLLFNFKDFRLVHDMGQDSRSFELARYDAASGDTVNFWIESPGPKPPGARATVEHLLVFKWLDAARKIGRWSDVGGTILGSGMTVAALPQGEGFPECQ